MDSEDHASALSSRGEQAAQISREMVRMMRKTAGRGPTKARTTIGRDQVLVVFQETLTQGEQVLIDNGHEDKVLQLRAGFQDVLREEAVAMVEEVLDRKVVGFLSNNHFRPDLAVEFFALDPAQSSHTGTLQEAEHEDDGP